MILTAKRDGGGVGCGCFLLILAVNLLIGGLTTEYVLEFWLTYAKGHPVDLPFLPCAIAGLFVGEFAIPAALLTWIISMCL